MNFKIKAIVNSTFLLVLMLNYSVFAQDGATLFKPCAACHSIGKGKMVGPDLKDITIRRDQAWLIKFIKSSKQMITAGDPAAIAIAREYNYSVMPDYNLTDEQIKLIISYIDGGITGPMTKADSIAAIVQKKLDKIIVANTAESILKGRDLYTGRLRFQHGGSSCIVCHNAAKQGYGGLLAKDLTNAHKRLGGIAGIKGIITTPPFPSMQETYLNHPVTEEEAVYISLYLQDINKKNPHGSVIQYWIVPVSAGVGAIVIAIFILSIWRKRKKESVNAEIINRQKRFSK